jgi:hypothetical protein
MKPSTLNILFLIAGLIGMPICIYGWQRWHQFLWLLGVGIFAYFFVSSLREILLKARGR